MSGHGSRSTTFEREQMVEKVEVLEAATAPCETARDFIRRGHALTRLGDDQAAAQAYGDAIQLEPKSALARCWRATRLIALGKYAAAEADISAALEIDGKSAEAYATRGALLQAQWRLENALNAYEQALALNPRLVEVYKRRAIIEFYRGQFELSLLDLRRRDCAAGSPLPWPSLLPIRLAHGAGSAKATEPPGARVLEKSENAKIISQALERCVTGDLQGAYTLLSPLRGDLSAESPATMMLLAMATSTFGENQQLTSTFGENQQLEEHWLSSGNRASNLVVSLIPEGQRASAEQGANQARSDLEAAIASNPATSAELLANVESKLKELTHFDEKKKRRVVNNDNLQQARENGTFYSLGQLLLQACESTSGILSADPLATVGIGGNLGRQQSALLLLIDTTLLQAELGPRRRSQSAL